MDEMNYRVCRTCKDSGYVVGGGGQIYCGCDIGKTTKVLDEVVSLGMARRTDDGRYIVQDGLTTEDILAARERAGMEND